MCKRQGYSMALVFIILFMGFFMIHLSCGNSASPYSSMDNRDYAKALGISAITCSYSDFISQKDCESEKHYHADNGAECIIVICDNVDYLFVQELTNTNEQGNVDYYLREVVIRNPYYRFGKYKIGVGSKREEIAKAYRKNAECYETEKLGSGYIDGYWLYVRFMYDENDCVSQMSISQE